MHKLIAIILLFCASPVFAQNSVPPGGPSSIVPAGLSQAVLDTIYLRLSGSNSPMTGQLKLISGTSGIPSLVFANSLNSGLYGFPGGFTAVASSVDAMLFGPAAVIMGTNVELQLTPGTLALPGMSFVGEATSGLRLSAAGIPSMVTAGVDRMLWSSASTINPLPMMVGANQAPRGNLHAQGDSSTNVAMMESVNSAINGAARALTLMHAIPGVMVDGFGTVLAFSVRDSNAVDNTIADIQAIRAGADSTGTLALRTAVAGALGNRLVFTGTLGTFSVDLVPDATGTRNIGSDANEFLRADIRRVIVDSGATSTPSLAWDDDPDGTGILFDVAGDDEMDISVNGSLVATFGGLTSGLTMQIQRDTVGRIDSWSQLGGAVGATVSTQTMPTCSVAAGTAGAQMYVDDTNDSKPGVWCFCNSNSSDVYAWEGMAFVIGVGPTSATCPP